MTLTLQSVDLRLCKTGLLILLQNSRIIGFLKDMFENDEASIWTFVSDLLYVSQREFEILQLAWQAQRQREPLQH
jgi:hypothetical protein